MKLIFCQSAPSLGNRYGNYVPIMVKFMVSGGMPTICLMSGPILWELFRSKVGNLKGQLCPADLSAALIASPQLPELLPVLHWRHPGTLPGLPCEIAEVVG